MTTALQQAIMAVDGVTEVFPARTLWQRLPGQAASLLQRNNADAPSLVEVREDGGRTEATVRIGVSPDARTPEVVRAEAAAVRSHLAPGNVAVQVTVVRIAAGPPPAGREG